MVNGTKMAKNAKSLFAAYPKVFAICIILLVLIGTFAYLAFVVEPRQAAQANAAEREVEVIKYQCQDGSVADNLANCPETKPIIREVEVLPEQPKKCLELVSQNKQTNKYGWLVILGEVKNNCFTEQRGAVTFTLYDNTGVVISSEITFTNPTEIPAGETYSFEKTWTDENVYSRYSRHKIVVG